MQIKQAGEIREAFLSFYENNGHTRVPSASLVPQNDPTLLFTAAGMVPFKDVFMGIEKRDYTRATSAQKCLRAGGKHNDLENVGFTGRHQTLFEMLGNFSFGDYFKQDAITWAWQFVTEVLKLPTDRLYVTVYKDDDEAYNIWHDQIGIPRSKIYRFGEEDNFWSAGEVGPCGPCSEIFYDQGEKFNTGDPELDRMGGDGDRFLEFYNLVFMQFNRDAQGTLTPLPKPSVDTGMGLERVSAIMQGARSNYETDLFQPIIEQTQSMSNKKYSSATDDSAVAFRVIADHIRAVTFLIAEGILPSNEGRGYVLRRILRRAVRYGKKLGFDAPFLHRLVPSVGDILGAQYSEIIEKQDFIMEAIRAEEDKFFKTLERGLSILHEELAKLKKGGDLPGKTAFLLYDSYGFPLDLTRVIAAEGGHAVDEDGFEVAMSRQRQQSKTSETQENAKIDDIYSDLADQNVESEFTGYHHLDDHGKVLALIQNGNTVEEVRAGSEPVLFEAVFDRTPFYPEGGGQIGDQGELIIDGSTVAAVRDVIKPLTNLIVVRGKLKPEQRIARHQLITQRVPRRERERVAANHTATHLLHWALREVLGSHIKQAGSLVTNDFLRFDYTHFQPTTISELDKIESIINERIFSGHMVTNEIMNKDDAIRAGALALFGEKYGESVRVIRIGDFSTELCGGTHVENTASIGLFVITSETGISAGVRRITALTNDTAFQYLKNKVRVIEELQVNLKANSDQDIIAKVERLQGGLKDMQREISKIQEKQAVLEADKLVKNAVEVNSVKVITHKMRGNAKVMRTLCERTREKFQDGVIIIAANDEIENKAHLMVSVSKNLTKSFHAGNIIKEIAPMIDGKGGGKPEMAQAGGTRVDGIDQALEKVQSLLNAT